MKIGIVPFYNGLLNNKLFDIEDVVLNADNLITPYFEIRTILREKQNLLETIDKYDNLSDVDCVLFFRLDYKLLYKCIRKRIKKIIYFAWEPEVVDERHSKKNLKKIECFFDAILTWNDDLVDNVKYYKINYPYSFSTTVKICNNEEFHNKKLLVNISGDKKSTHKYQLYSERLKVIEFYNKRNRSDFELYGRGWLGNLKCYKGECVNKTDVYRQFKFALCLENMCEVNGYITEKIFDCFMSGIVPVYFGAKNISNYIPKDCYIDYRRFTDIAELDNFLSSMTYQEYTKYIKSANKFLDSSKKYVFTSSFFCDAVNTILVEVTQRNNRQIWKLFILRIVYVIKAKFKKMAFT